MNSKLYEECVLFLDTLASLKDGETLSTVWSDVSIEKRSFFSSLMRTGFGDSRTRSVDLVKSKVSKIRDVCLLYLTALNFTTLSDKRLRKVSSGDIKSKPVQSESKNKPIESSDFEQEFDRVSFILAPICSFPIRDLEFWLVSIIDRIPNAIKGIMSLRKTYMHEADDIKSQFVMSAQQLAKLFNELVTTMHLKPPLYDLHKFSIVSRLPLDESDATTSTSSPPPAPSES